MKKYIIDHSGSKVWVNSPISLLGRFGPFGIDVHSDERKGGFQHCLYCTHEKTGIAEWNTFVQKMSEHHSIDIPTRISKAVMKCLLQKKEKKNDTR